MFSKTVQEVTGASAPHFATLAEAKAYIANNPSGNGYEVNIRAGKYYIPSYMQFNENDGGTKNAPVVYRAYNDEKVEIIGGVEIDLSDMSGVTDESVNIKQDVRDYVKQVNLADYGINSIDAMSTFGHGNAYLQQYGIPFSDNPYYTVLFEDELMTLARWPNNGYATVSNVIDAGSIDDNRGFEFTFADTNKISEWANAENMGVHGYWYYDYTDFATPAHVDSNNLSIKTQYPSRWGVRAGQRFYVYNLIEELDSPGEWYIDREKDILYFYPPQESGKLVLSTVSAAIFRTSNASDMVFSGLTLKGSRGQGFSINSSDNIMITNCTIYGTTKYGIYMTDTINSKMKNNHVHHTGRGGIYAAGGSIVSGIEGANLVYNNQIHDYSTVQKCYSPGITLSGYKNKAQNNEVYNGEHNALTMIGNDNLMEYNEIHDVLKEASDMGAFYAGNAKTCRGNILRNNYFHDLYSDSSITSTSIQAVFLDDLLDGYTVEQNIFENIGGNGVTIGGGRNNTITNNVFVNVAGNISIRGNGLQFPERYGPVILQETNIANGLYKTAIYSKYPGLANLLEDEPLAPKYNVVNYNMTYGQENDITFVLYGEYGEEYIKNECDSDYTESIQAADGNYLNYQSVSGGFTAPEYGKIGRVE